MNKKLLLIYALPAISLSACVAGGTQVKESQLSQFHKGKTTIREVVDALGDPNTNSLLPDGSRMLCYAYVQAAARPETFIPIVGAFVGGADSRSNTTCFQFAENGILKGYTSTSSKFGSGSNLASGVHGDTRTPNEPKQAK